MAINKEQLQFAVKGHNLLLTGQAGAGKSRVVGSIIQECNRTNFLVVAVCSGGIACKVYQRGTASTVHSFYCLGTADLPSNQLIQRAKANSLVAEKIKNLDVIIWDEASRPSARMLELVIVCTTNCLIPTMYFHLPANSSFLSANFISYAQFQVSSTMDVICSNPMFSTSRFLIDSN